MVEALHKLVNETDPRVVQQLWSGDPMALLKLQALIWRVRETAQKAIVRPFAAWVRRTIARVAAGPAAEAGRS